MTTEHFHNTAPDHYARLVNLYGETTNAESKPEKITRWVEIGAGPAKLVFFEAKA